MAGPTPRPVLQLAPLIAVALTVGWRAPLERGSGTSHPRTSFFATSLGSGSAGGDFDGLVGADLRCSLLAEGAGLPADGWVAYLSTTTIDARDRLSRGPWYNAAGTLVAADVDDLHANGISAANVLDEHGATVPTSVHDIVTGSDGEGRMHDPVANCEDFESLSALSYTSVGHSDGGGVGTGVPTSWNSAHLTPCDEMGMQSTSGEGRIYCFGSIIFFDGFENGGTSAWDLDLP